ncbi:MAG: hypothetical protein IPL59_08205 [Candidatus Competibacteraceae bacterium]|nr:hypothetical protein [Candidatus Competibacteraceae bacterium]
MNQHGQVIGFSTTAGRAPPMPSHTAAGV